MKQIDKQLLDKWLSEDYSGMERLRNIFWAFYFLKVPKVFHRTFWFKSVLESVPALGAPLVAHYVYAKISSNEAWIAALILFGLVIIRRILEGLLRETTDKRGLMREAMFIRIGDFISTLKRDAIVRKENRRAQEACLGLVHNIAMSVTKLDTKDIGVSLVVYKGTTKEKMHLAARNPGTERQQVCDNILAKSLLGHYVCEQGVSAKVLDNISFFKGSIESPTRAQMPYRSILFLPVEMHNCAAKGVAGFISIDANKPYAFFGTREADIESFCRPIKTMIECTL